MILCASLHTGNYFVHVSYLCFKNVKLVFIFSVILTIKMSYFTVHILVKAFVLNNSYTFKFSLEVVKQIIGRVMRLTCTDEI